MASTRISRSLVTRASQWPRTSQWHSVRNYAQAASNADTKPPVALFGVDGTYASALYVASAKNSAVENTAKALSTLQEIIKRDEKLTGVLSAPSLTSDDKAEIVKELQKQAGDKSEIFKNFLATLAENNRLGLLNGVCDKFAVLTRASRGEIDLVVTSASKLDPKVLQRIEAAVSKSEYSQGKKLKVVQKVEPNIIGGLVVEIGDRTIDSSVSSKIAKMNKLLTDSV